MADRVVDASALAALIFGEPEADAVERRLAGHRLIAPTLLPYEMASVCLKKLRANPAEREAILARFGIFPELPIELAAVSPSAIAESAPVLGLTAYDTAYLLLAMLEGAELTTLDTALAEAFRRISSRET